MALSGSWICVVLAAGILVAAWPSVAKPNVCVSALAPDSPEVDVKVKISESRSACFLVPRNVTNKEVRKFYGVSSSASLHFEPSDLYGYLRGKTAVRVGSEVRGVDQARLNCLANPEPDAISIVDGRPFSPSPTVPNLKAQLLAIQRSLSPGSSDLQGYRRYESEGEHYYFPDATADAQLSFWCAHYWGPEEMCVIQGEYDDMATAFIRYRKESMERVRPDEAVECVRAIGDLFRVDNDES